MPRGRAPTTAAATSMPTASAVKSAIMSLRPWKRWIGWPPSQLTPAG
jgi:hypothetical protein